MGTHQKYMNRYATNIRHNEEIAKYFLEEEYATGTIIRCELAVGMEMLFFDFISKSKTGIHNRSDGLWK